jgi:xanthine dehydrogenase small subunit
MSGEIRFVLDGEIRVVSDPDPTRTVLMYLREDLGRTGTKEGCAEGDCGACTVVVRELAGEGTRARAINSCLQFLPTLDGKELVTVESLQRPGDTLHPVQQAMVEQHASQCGFCTPGFVMSLYALYETKRAASRDEVTDALAGNLCRCTGYRPILDAAQAMYRIGSMPGLDAPAVARLRSLQRDRALTIEEGAHQYFAPVTLAELAQLREAYPQARILAGGTDVGLWVTKGLQDIPAIIYVGNVAELRRIHATGAYLELGAAVTWTDAFGPLTEHFPELSELLRRFASPPIRNAATIGGNIANGSPIGDSMPALMVLGARLRLRRGEAVRDLGLDEFYLGYQRNALEAGEFVESVRIPLRAGEQHFRTYKLSKRFDQDISALCAAFWVDVRGGRVNAARVAYGGMAAVPARARHCEEALAGRPWSLPSVANAMDALAQDYTPISDMRAGAPYRAATARTLLYRFALETLDGTVATSVRAFGQSA